MSIYTSARLGHKTIVAPLGANHLRGVYRALIGFSGSATFSRGDFAFLNEKGIDTLIRTRSKIKHHIPAQRLQRVFAKQGCKESLKRKQKDLKQRFNKLTSDVRVWNN
mmetsp:Transcript_16117/g.37726  ORF Transcript_16117/g.37726 Transcript_16117/m.37726 type:complete len:108 (-) Transcript_16117:153-476(-)